MIFVDASSQAQLETDLALSIRSLGPEYSEMTWKEAVAYLDSKEKGWLLFIDNADSPELDLRPYFPRSSHGAILITTRNRASVEYALDGAIAVGGLEENEAVSLLHAVADVAPTSDAKSLEIVRELGMLALPITQAGAYIRKTHRLDTYLNTFRSHRDQLMRTQPDRGTDYTSSTYAAFDLSFQQLPAKTQELLKLFAFLYHSLVPTFLFEQSVMSGFTAYTVRTSFPPAESDRTFISSLEWTLGTKWDEVALQEIVDPASRASLINISTDGLCYSIHPLVQTYIQDGLGEEKIQPYIRTTAQLLLGAIRPVEGSNSRHWQLLPHINNIPRSVQTENVAHALAFHGFYNSLGDRRPCRELLESALSRIQVTLGERCEETVWLKGALANALWNCGKLDDAETMQREVLALRLDVHGEKHPDTIFAMSSLANTLRTRGQLDDAEKMKREVLALRREIHGERHPDTIDAMHNLANTLHNRGQWGEAEKLQREVLAVRLEIHGDRHPDTVKAMHNLATTLHDRGQLDDAEKLEREVLALQLDIQGGRHSETIRAMYNLALTLYTSGQLEYAEKMKREVLALRPEIHDGRHPDIFNTSFNLSLTLPECDKLEEAAKLLQELIPLRIEILGEDHHRTVKAKKLLKHVLSGQIRSRRL